MDRLEDRCGLRTAANAAERAFSAGTKKPGFGFMTVRRLFAFAFSITLIAASTQPGAATPSSIRFVYFMPADKSFTPDFSTGIANGARALRLWYAGQLGGKTYVLNNPIVEVCGSPSPESYFATSSYSRVFDAVKVCFPQITYNDPLHRWVIYADVRHTCNAPERLGAGGYGITIMPVQDLQGLAGRSSILDDCGVAHSWDQTGIDRWIGGLGHELGHALGLPHPPNCDQGLPNCDSNALMWAGYAAYPNTYLRAEEKQALLAGPFFFAPEQVPTDLGVQQSASPNPASVGKDVVFTLTASNNGSADATGITLTNPIPAGTTLVWASPGCTSASGMVTCQLSTLAAGASTPFKLVLRGPAAGSITNSVGISATQPDPNSANNGNALAVTVDNTPPGVAIFRYRLYSDVTKEHHFTTDFNEYTVLDGSPSWVGEGTVGKVLNNPGSFGGVTAVPYYRLYNTDTQWHHWTTDVNEYYTLIGFPGWIGEGVDGYILPGIAVGATQLYRLNYPALGSLHHWTIDANEYNTLITSYGWVGEGGAGFVIH